MPSSENELDEKLKKIILSHRLVPEHRVLSKEEAQKVIEKYCGGDKYKLPYIRKSDPIVKALGAKKDDVIMIIRRSPTAGVSVYYRLVIG